MAWLAHSWRRGRGGWLLPAGCRSGRSPLPPPLTSAPQPPPPPAPRSDFKANPDYKGVCHVALAQEGHCKPGEVLFGTDSHTCNAGAFGQFATGVGNTDAGFILGTGKLLIKVGGRCGRGGRGRFEVPVLRANLRGSSWAAGVARRGHGRRQAAQLNRGACAPPPTLSAPHPPPIPQVPPTMRFLLEGEMPEYLLAKDLILQIIGEITVAGATYKAMEFGARRRLGDAAALGRLGPLPSGQPAGSRRRQLRLAPVPRRTLLNPPPLIPDPTPPPKAAPRSRA
jgi:hypothetical protein